MDRMEALEELQEMNKREVRINYDGMLSKYDAIREQEKVDEEAKDEEFIKEVMETRKIKRLVDADSSSDDDAAAAATAPVKKAPKTGMFSKKGAAAAVTDVLTSGTSSKSAAAATVVVGKKQPSWAKSVGGLGVKKSTKNSLGVIVKKKT